MITPKHQGFTLIEIAVVLVVISVLITIVAVPLRTQVEQKRIEETQKKLELVKEALYGFAIVNGRLPRPAISSSNGTENTTLCATNTACTGFIPWVTLGINSADSWDNIIRYTVTPAFTIAVPAGSNAAFSLITASTKIIRTRDSAGTETDLTLSAAPTVPAAVWSHGAKNFGNDAITGTARPNNLTTNLDEIRNNTLAISAAPCATQGTCVISRLQSDNSSATYGGEFDDIVSWISSNTLFARMVQAGKLP